MRTGKKSKPPRKKKKPDNNIYIYITKPTPPIKKGKNKKMKDALVVLVEALVIGACLALMLYVGLRVAPRGTANTVFVAFVCGAVFHIACEVSGLNEWYARTYFAPGA